MSNVNEMNQELVRAFNISLCYNSIAITNLTVQNLHGKDHIVISFDKNMDSKQCMKYLNNMKEKIIKRSYRDEKAAGVSYNLKFFPFAFNTKHLPRDDKGRKKFSVEIDEGVVFNLKCYLAKALAGDVKEGMGKKRGPEYLRGHIYNASFDRNSYLCCMLFHDKGLQKDFVDLFSAQIRRYGNAPSDYLEENGDLVYIKKSIFDDVEFIKDIEAYNASLICRHFQTHSTKSKAVDKLKYTIVNFMDKVANIPVRTIIRTSYKGSDENSVLIPIVTQNVKDNRLFDDNDAHKANNVFGIEILSDVGGDISMKLPRSGSSDSTVYGIDFSDLDISYYVMNKIIESSVIDKDHELSIDPELHFRALSPPGTPPNQRDRDSGYDSNSPPKLKDSVAHSSSGGPGPSTELSDMEWESPTCSQDVASKDSPRRGSGTETEKEEQLYDPVNSTGTSKGSWSSTQLSLSTVNQDVSGPSKGGNLGAAAASGSIPGSSLWSQNGASSSRGAGENMPTGSSFWCLPPSTSSLTTRNDPISSNLGIFADPPEDTENICSMKPEKQQVTDESDRKSSDEYSEAQSQESESPKKHGGGVQKIKKLFSSPFKKQYDVNLKRHDVGRDTTRSMPAISVTKKPPLSKSFFSFPTRIRAKSNPPSEVTSPTHEGAPGGLKPLTSDKRKELRPLLSPEQQRKLESNSFLPGEEQHLYLTHTLSGKRELSRSLCEGEESQLLRLAEAQLSSPDNSSSKKVDRDSGFCSMGSPAVPHKGSVSSEVKECRTVEHTRETWGKRI